MSRVTYFVRMTAKEGKAEEVEQLLLTNYTRIKEGEPGNLTFAVPCSTDDSNEFWLYETPGQELVDAHESGAAFETYKKKLRPMVVGDTVLFGNVTPIAVLGYET